MELLAERRFGPALAAAEAEPDPRLRAGAECEIAYAGRDFEGALAAAERGLALAPADPRLLQLACASALWLQDVRLAIALARRFEEGVRAVELEPASRDSWIALARDYAERAAQLAQREAERDAALARARGVSAAVLGLVLLAALGLARGARGAAALSAGS